MKVLTIDGLSKLIQFIKSSFISNEDTIETSNVTLAQVATSGSYNDLSNKPTIPVVNVATTSSIGLVKPDGVSVIIQPDGTITSKSGSLIINDYTEDEEEEESE